MSELIATVALMAAAGLAVVVVLLIIEGLFFFAGFVLTLIAFLIYFRETQI